MSFSYTPIFSERIKGVKCIMGAKYIMGMTGLSALWACNIMGVGRLMGRHGLSALWVRNIMGMMGFNILRVRSPLRDGADKLVTPYQNIKGLGQVVPE
jgi:hypothetical protein